jgi:hypothetical protein
MSSESMRAEQHLSKAPPVTLYHYTDQNALLKIMESRNLWATKVQYLNDFMEFNLAVDIAKRKLAARRSLHPETQGIKKLIDTIIDGLSRITNVNICAVSFCEHDDLLSQWRGYTRAGGGVSIGFRSGSLADLARREQGRLGPCIYDVETQNDVISEIIDNVIANAMEGSEVHSSEDFNRQLIEYGAFFKNNGFREEHEWRLITGIKLYRDEGFKFRPGYSMLTPYYIAQLAPKGWHDEIASVTIGPCPYPAASGQAITGLFLKQGLYLPHSGFGSERDFVVRLSQIPYRNW